MIRITIEILPFGFEDNKRTVGSMEIYNDATGTATRGNYVFKLFDKLGRKRFTGEIKDFPRKQLTTWDLLFRILKMIVGYRNTESRLYKE